MKIKIIPGGLPELSRKMANSYFKKRCQKKSEKPIGQDPQVVWVVSNGSLLLQLKGSSRSHDDDAEDND